MFLYLYQSGILKHMIFIELQKNTEVLKNDNEFIMHYSFHFRVFESQIKMLQKL